MPNRPETRSETDLSNEELSFEALLSGAPLPAGAAASGQFLADAVGALSAPAADDELAGFDTALAAYTNCFVTQPLPGRVLHWRPAMRTTLFSPKIATAVAAGVLGLGGLSAAAYAGALPDTAQQVAHHIIGAPDGHPGKGASHAPEGTGAPDGTGGPASTPTGPDATGAAAFGLCNAYAHANDKAFEGSVAFANLAATAGGADKVEAYCAAITHPGSAAASHPAGPPSSLPAGPTGRPSALPTHPAGPPSTVPAGPTGRPSALPTHPAGPPSSLPAGPTDHPTGKPSALPPHPTGKPSTVPTSRPTGH